MMDMVSLHDPDGTYTYVTPSVVKLLGYQPEDLIGSNPYDIIHPADIEHVRSESHEQAKKGMQIFSTEYRIRKKDGKYLWFDTNTMPIKNKKGEIVQLQSVSRDISKRKAHRQKLLKLNEELEELNAQKDKLLGIISHDLRNPFQNFNGLFDLVLKDFDRYSKEELHEMLLELKKSCDGAFSLLQDLLLWSRNEFGTLEVNLKCINPFLSVHQVIQYLEYFARKKNITLENNIDDNLECDTDPHIFRTIIRNLISNAIKFSPDNTTIRIHAKDTDDFTYFSVTDHGVGIAQKDISRILNVNAIHSTPGTAGEKGIGLGLSLCQEFITKMGGELKIESKTNQGSTFTFSIPKC